MTEILLGIVLPILLFSTGIFFFFYLQGHPFRKPRLFARAVRQATFHGGKQALLTALAGTLGVGNISGVASAVTLGGPGALFWMWVCAFVAMIVKYAEIVLALDRRREGHGGAMYYIGKKRWAVLFALLCLACGFSMGNMVQVKAASEAIKVAFGTGKATVATAFALILPLVLYSGKRGVFRFAEKAVPIMTVLYCILATALICCHRHNLPHAFSMIFRNAFSLKAAGGGIGASALVLGLRYGAARGMISNEAGCGTAPIAHAASDNAPATQGCLGVIEVFVDTILLCTLTGLGILVSPVQSGSSGTVLVMRAFESVFEKTADYLLAPAMVLFAFATVVCWFYYCTECAVFLTGSERYQRILMLLYCALCLVSLLFSEEKLFIASDLIIFFMASLNLPALIQNRKRIRQNALSYFQS